jgi:hypothetical protein
MQVGDNGAFPRALCVLGSPYFTQRTELVHLCNGRCEARDSLFRFVAGEADAYDPCLQDFVLPHCVT